MMQFEQVGMAYRNRKRAISWVFREVDFSFTKGNDLGILAPRGQGKTTFIQVAAGNEAPSEGNIYRMARNSWPYGSKNTISPKLSGRQNLRFLTDVYGRNFSDVCDFVAEFSDLGRYIDAPLKQYNNEMKARLSISALFAMEFDCILVDDSMDGGDNSFRRRCLEYIEANRSKFTFLIASSNPLIISKYCKVGGLLNDGKLTLFDTVAEAIEEFEQVNQTFV